MCGIAGILSFERARPVDEIALRAMAATIEHRGPDDHGFYLRPEIGLAHRRLSILDVEGGHQPWLDRERGRALVYNGEIYNFQEIAAEECRRGASFTSTCDTEVLMHLAATPGSEWLHRLNGMFAFAHWDGEELLLVRDRIGIKPLYLATHDGFFYFASEIKALLAAGVPARINRNVVPEFLAFRHVCGAHTLFEGITELPPGHLLRIRPNQRNTEPVRWWKARPAVKGAYVDPELPVDEQFRELFASSVQSRMIADVPLGTYNSGGVDSSLISAFVRERAQGTLHTFSVGFEEEDHDESRYARIVADTLGTEHHALVVSGREYADGVEEAVDLYDQPLFQDHTIQLMKLSKLAKEFVTVVLTGEGADELFAGYPRYQIPLLAGRLAFIPGPLQRALLTPARLLRLRRLVKLLEISSDPDRSILENARFSPLAGLRTLGLSEWVTPHRRKLLSQCRDMGLTPLEVVLNHDRNSYMPGLLHRLDRTTMVNGVEARVPFLDHRLLEWSMGVAADHKIVIGRENKVTVKKVAAEIFPHEMIYRRKVGFGVPTGHWLRQPRSLGRFLDLLQDRPFKERGLVKAEAVQKLVAEHLAQKADHGHLLWSVINLELWCRRLVDKGTHPYEP